MAIKKKTMLTQDVLKSKVDYNPETGLFVWNSGHLLGEQVCPKDNRVKFNEYGTFPLSELVFLYMENFLPVEKVGFKNSDSSDFSYSNLLIIPDELNAENLKQWCDYDPLTGCFSAYRTRISKKETVTYQNDSGYYFLNWKRQGYWVHRLAYIFMTGEDIPEGFFIDHVNRDRLDNRWENLRLANLIQNRANSSRPLGKSGYIGVKEQDSGKWRAGWCGKTLGMYDSPHLAAYVYNTHILKQYGEFAYLNDIKHEIKKALILAGGTGSRLRPLTWSRSKQVLPVGGKPAICHSVDAILATGIVEIGIVISKESQDDVKNVIDYYYPHLKGVRYIIQEEAKGLAHAVLVAEKFIKEDPFFMLLGDNIIQYDLNDLLKQFLVDTPSSCILLKEVSNPTAFGVAEIENGKVKSLQEKPKNPRSNLAITGFYAFSPEIVQACKSIDYSERGELEITDAISWLIKNGRTVSFKQVEGYWVDVGKKDSLLEANKILLDQLAVPYRNFKDSDNQITGRVLIGEGAQISGCQIEGPVIIGRGSIIKDSKIGSYTVIGEDCQINNMNIRDSIIMERVELDSLPKQLEHSIISEDVSIKQDSRDLHFIIIGSGAMVKL